METRRLHALFLFQGVTITIKSGGAGCFYLISLFGAHTSKKVTGLPCFIAGPSSPMVDWIYLCFLTSHSTLMKNTAIRQRCMIYIICTECSPLQRGHARNREPSFLRGIGTDSGKYHFPLPLLKGGTLGPRNIALSYPYGLGHRVVTLLFFSGV